jgi:hypothetical protein
MKLTRITLLILAILSSPTSVSLQKRSSRKKPTRPPQTRLESPPVESPSPLPQKSEVELLIEKDKATLSKLTEDDKQTVRAGLEALNKTIRLYKLRGYDKQLLSTLEREGTDNTVSKALTVLPASSLKKLIASAENTISDALRADMYYYEGFDRSEPDVLIGLADKYELADVPGYLIGRRIFERAYQILAIAVALAVETSVLPQPEAH